MASARFCEDGIADARDLAFEVQTLGGGLIVDRLIGQDGFVEVRVRVVVDPGASKAAQQRMVLGAGHIARHGCQSRQREDHSAHQGVESAAQPDTGRGYDHFHDHRVCFEMDDVMIV